MSAYDGKDCQVSFAIQPETATVGALTWLTVGMMTTKGFSGEWDMADTTADSTANAGKTVIATRMSSSVSISGVSRDEDIYRQKMLKAQFFNPGALTQYQPKVWLRLIYPTGDTFIGPYMMKSWKEDAPDADKQTWSLDAEINGRAALTQV